MPSSTVFVQKFVNAAIGAAIFVLAVVPASGEGTDLSRTRPADLAYEAALRYVEGYQRALTAVVADEDYRQERRATNQPTESRVMRGELFVMFTEGTQWIAVHDFAQVDGVAVPDRATFAELLAREDMRPAVAAVANRNARYNLGSVTRNFNEPTLALKLFESERRDRLRLTRTRVAVRDGRMVATLRLVERERPTLISSPRGAIYAEVEADVDTVNGAILRTRLSLRDGPTDVVLETMFENDVALQMLVPSTFTEEYTRRSGAGQREVIQCRATYSNFRRFQTAGRVVF
jgi:hypothetical protein